MFVLEPRVMLDGAAALEAVETLNMDSDSLLKELALTAPVTDVSRSTQSTDKTTTSDLSVVTPLASGPDRVELVFIDSRVDLEIVDGFASDSIFSISADDDAFAKMAEIAATFGSVDAIHVVSHGADGELQLGNQTYSSLNIDSYQTSLTSLGGALTESGDLLFYACDLAASEKGVQFIETLSTITGADIAASDDATGIGGDSDLEVSEGDISTVELALVDLLQTSLSIETFTQIDLSGENLQITSYAPLQDFGAPVGTDQLGNTNTGIPFSTFGYDDPSNINDGVLGYVLSPGVADASVTIDVPNLSGQSTMYALLNNFSGEAKDTPEYTVTVNFTTGDPVSFAARAGVETRDFNQNSSNGLTSDDVAVWWSNYDGINDGVDDFQRLDVRQFDLSDHSSRTIDSITLTTLGPNAGDLAMLSGLTFSTGVTKDWSGLDKTGTDISNIKLIDNSDLTPPDSTALSPSLVGGDKIDVLVYIYGAQVDKSSTITPVFSADTTNYNVTTRSTAFDSNTADYDLIIVQEPTPRSGSSIMTTAERAYLASQLDRGARVMIIGENGSWGAADANGVNPTITATVADLGGSIEVDLTYSLTSSEGQITNTAANASGGGINNHELTAGVTSIKFGTHGGLNIDPDITEPLVVDKNQRVVMAEQAISNGRLFIVTDYNWLDAVDSQEATLLKNAAINAYNNIKSVEAGGDPNYGYGLSNTSPPYVFDPGSVLTADERSAGVEFAHDNSYSVSSFTAELWVKPDSSSSQWQPLFMKADEEGNTPSRNFSLWIKENSLDIHATFYSSAGNQVIIESTGYEEFATQSSGTAASLTADEWNHLAFSYDSSTGSIALYINGDAVWVGTVGAADRTPATNTESIYIGGNPDGYSTLGPFNGSIADVRLYNVGLSQAAIQQNKTEVVTGSETNLVFATRFQQNGDEELLELVSSTYSGTFFEGLTGSASGNVSDPGAYVQAQITTPEDTAYSILAADFSTNFLYSASDSSAFTAVKVTSLPSNGDLTLDGVAVTAGQAINLSAMTSDRFRYTPDSNFTGAETFQWKAVNAAGSFSNVVSFGITVESTDDPTDFTVTAANPSSLDFDGTNDYLTSDASLLNNLSQFTVSFWVKPDDNAKFNTDPTDYSSRQSLVGQNDAFEIFLAGNDIGFYNSAGGPTIYMDANLVADEWTHITITGDVSATTDTIRVIKNGDVANAVTRDLTISASDFGDSSYDFTIGGYVLDASLAKMYPLDGELDEVSVWSTVLSDEVISTISDTKFNGSETGLIGYWSFDESTGTVANNLKTGAAASSDLDFGTSAVPTWAASDLDVVTTFTVGQDTTVLAAPGMTVTDVDSDISSISVKISSHFTSGDVLAFTNDSSSMGNIAAASFDTSTGVLTLSSSDASATDAEWANALSAVTFATSAISGGSDRTITWTSTTGNSESVTSRIAVVYPEATPFVEGDSAKPLLPNFQFDTSTDYIGGYVEFEVGSTGDVENLTLASVATASVANGDVSIVNGQVFVGDGTTANSIGAVDAVKNGLNGQPLRINFENQFGNGDFAATTAVDNGDGTVSIPGWTIYLQQAVLGPDTSGDSSLTLSTIAGQPAPTDSSPSPQNPSGTQTSRGDDFAPRSASFNYSLGNNELRLYSSMTTSAGGDVVHGPYVVSNNPVAMVAGDSVSFNWRAQNGADAYDVYAYIVDVNTGTTQELLNTTGAGSTSMTTKTVTVAADGNYKFVFVSGTFDETFGRAAGASLYIDAITLTQGANAPQPDPVTSAHIEAIARSLRYENSSEEIDDTGYVSRTLTMKTAESGSDPVTALDTTFSELGISDAPEFADDVVARTMINHADFNNAGQTVTALLNSEFSDADGDELGGIVVTASGADASTEGSWQYSTDSGTNWYDIDPTDYSTTGGLVLSAATTLRFSPVAGYSGDPGVLTVFAVDDRYSGSFTSGATTQTYNTSTDDLTAHVAAASVEISITVNPVDQASVLDLSTGLATSYTENASAIALAPNLTLTDPDSTVAGAKVTIENFKTGDTLSADLTGVTGVTQSFSTATGVLTLSGAKTAADYQAVLRTVTFSSSGDNPDVTDRSITFSIGDAISLAFADGTTHFYQYVADSGINWNDALADAASYTYNGMLGHLVTVTTAEENAFIKDKLEGNAWLAAADSGTEGVWQWMAGPETGIQFWEGDLSAGSSITTNYGAAVTDASDIDLDGDTTDLTFAAWASGEPNNWSGIEDVAHFYSSDGSWNDYAASNTNVAGYVVEYSTSGAVTFSQTMTLSVAALNDDPSLTGNVAATTILEDPSSNGGQTIDALFTSKFSDPDSDSFTGVVIVGNASDASTEGSWQYSTDGSSWFNVGSVSTSEGLVLSKTTLLRFNPVANYHGTPDPLALHSFDDSVSQSVTSGSSRVTFDTTADSPVAGQDESHVSPSSRNLTISVTSVADSPEAIATPGALRLTKGDDYTYDFSNAFFHGDGDTLTYAITGTPSGLTFDNTTGVLTGQVDEAESYTVAVTATDSSSNSVTTTFTVEVKPKFVPPSTGPSEVSIGSSPTSQTTTSITTTGNRTIVSTGEIAGTPTVQPSVFNPGTVFSPTTSVTSTTTVGGFGSTSTNNAPGFSANTPVSQIASGQTGLDGNPGQTSFTARLAQVTGSSTQTPAGGGINTPAGTPGVSGPGMTNSLIGGGIAANPTVTLGGGVTTPGVSPIGSGLANDTVTGNTPGTSTGGLQGGSIAGSTTGNGNSPGDSGISGSTELAGTQQQAAGGFGIAAPNTAPISGSDGGNENFGFNAPPLGGVGGPSSAERSGQGDGDFAGFGGQPGTGGANGDVAGSATSNSSTGALARGADAAGGPGIASGDGATPTEGAGIGNLAFAPQAGGAQTANGPTATAGANGATSSGEGAGTEAANAVTGVTQSGATNGTDAGSAQAGSQATAAGVAGDAGTAGGEGAAEATALANAPTAQSGGAESQAGGPEGPATQRAANGGPAATGNGAAEAAQAANAPGGADGQAAGGDADVQTATAEQAGAQKSTESVIDPTTGVVDAKVSNALMKMGTNITRQIDRVVVQVGADGQVDSSTLARNDAENPSGLQIVRVTQVGRSIEADLADNGRAQVQEYQAVLVAPDGSQQPLPDWIKIDAETGKLTGEPPAGVDSINLAIKAVDANGESRVIILNLNVAEGAAVAPAEGENLGFVEPVKSHGTERFTEQLKRSVQAVA